jgi:hypothetical protein
MGADGAGTAGANLSMNGSGRINVGEVRGDHATATLTGCGHLDLVDLASEQADLTSTGSGGLTANVKQSLVAQNGGSGGIRVYGNPAQRSVNGKLVQIVN